MSNKIQSDSHSTTQVKNLLKKIYGKSILKDSLLERAIDFYDIQPFNEKNLDALKKRTLELETQKSDEKVQRQLDKIEREYRDLKQDLKFESNERYKYLANISREVITLSEGSTFEESNRKSAQFLGCIQLLSPTEGKNIAEVNECHKPLYKAILCLRLLDKLCYEKTTIIEDLHIKKWLSSKFSDQYKTLQQIDKEAYQAFIDNVKMPLVMAALLQDIGHFHQDAQQIVKGVDGTLDPYRMLPIEDRKALLQINYRETIKFLSEGIGAPTYVGNSKTDRDKFNLAEHQKLLFIKSLLKNAIAPKQGIGNLLKVPQIYTSIILSTKASYNFKLLPKVYQALNQNAERGTCSQLVVDGLRAITGDYPQGFGITYIPTDSDGKKGEQYEYAIVNSLYPINIQHPHCRTATRNLSFVSHGQDIILPIEANLHNTHTAKLFASISKDRLNEILTLLSSNYHERKKLDLLPRCWHPDDFYSMKDHQNLWNKSG